MLRSIKIGLRSALLFGVLGVITLMLGVFSLTQLNTLFTSSSELGQERMPLITVTGNMRVDFMASRLSGLSFILAENANEKQAVKQKTDQHVAAYTHKLEQLKEMSDNPEALSILDRLGEALNSYSVGLEDFFKAADGGSVHEIKQIRENTLDIISVEVIETMAEFVQYQNNKANEIIEHSADLNTTSFYSISFAIVVSLAAIVLFAVLFSRSIVIPIRRAATEAEYIAAGDLRHDFEDNAQDEAGALLRALARMQNQLHGTIENITDSSHQLASTSEELSQVTNDSTKVVQEQSDQLEQAATAVNELTTAIDEVATSANLTSSNSEQVNSKSQEGLLKLNSSAESLATLVENINNTSNAISDLSGNVNEIGTVIDVIKAIAEQTNLLALNAAIEAARAGESGRGFAVVADEVRALAHRTQQSTEEIERMIHDVQANTGSAVSNMQKSTEYADTTMSTSQELGESLREVVGLIGQINEQNINIASAAEEQAMVAREVDQNLVSIRDLSFQTSAGANQTNASSQELAGLAERLSELIREFKL